MVLYVKDMTERWLTCAWTGVLCLSLIAATGCAESKDDPSGACSPASKGVSDKVQVTRPTGYSPDFTLESFNSELDVMVIDTKGLKVPDEPKVDAVLSVYSAAPPVGVANFQSGIGIELRGSSSLFYPKKQFSFEIRDRDGKDFDFALSKLPAEADWVLNGTYADATVLRNHLAYALTRMSGRYAPRTAPVEVFLNQSGSALNTADYLGLFTLTERIERSGKRVALTDDSFLVEFVDDTGLRPGDPCVSLSMTSAAIVWPKSDALSGARLSEIQNTLEMFIQDLYEGNLAAIEKEADMGAFIDYLLVQEFMRNNDAFYRSVFVYRAGDGRLTFGPVWDMDTTAGALARLTVDGFTTADRPWAEAVLKIASIRNRIAARWHELRADQWSTEALEALFMSARARVASAAERNEARWQMLKQESPPEVPAAYPHTPAGEFDRLHDWLIERAVWLDEHIGSLEATSTFNPGAP